MFNDIKTKYDRIGFSILFRKVAQAVMMAGIGTMLIVLMATVFLNYATAQMNAKLVADNIRYHDTHK